MIEVENVQVDARDLHEAHPDESVGEVSDFFQTNNLLVPLMTVPSGIATKHEEERFARLPCRRLGAIEVRVPAELPRGLRGLRLRESGRGGEKKAPQDESANLFC